MKHTPDKAGQLQDFLDGLVSGHACPGVVASVCDPERTLFAHVAGDKQLVPERSPMHASTLFDLASVTKVVSTTMVAAKLCDEGLLWYDRPLRYYLPKPGNYGDVSILQLLTHSGGFISENHLDQHIKAPDEALDYILRSPPIALPGTLYEYSCFGFIVLGKILELVCKDSLDSIASKLVFLPLKMHSTMYNPLASHADPKNIAATEVAKCTDNVLVGSVHDENARFLGGVAGNAGVFSTLEDMLKLCTMILRDGASDTGKFLSHERIQEFSKDFTPTLEVGRSIGFSLGGRGGTPAEVGTYGHTGFTGTSIWINPKHELAAILLTNRVHPSRDNQLLLPLRKTFHNLAFCLGANSHGKKVQE